MKKLLLLSIALLLFNCSAPDKPNCGSVEKKTQKYLNYPNDLRYYLFVNGSAIEVPSATYFKMNVGDNFCG